MNYEWFKETTKGGTLSLYTVPPEHREKLLTEYVDVLGEVMRNEKRDYHFETCAIVILPEHIHALWK